MSQTKATQIKTRREEYAEITKQALIEESFKLFVEKGYAKTSIDEIVQNARVTKGALYHHFQNKEALFRAAYEYQVRGLTAVVAKAIQASSDPWEKALIGCNAFIDHGLNSKQKNIRLQEAITVLGWEQWRELDASYTMGIIQQVITELIESNIYPHQNITILSDMIYSLLVETSMTIMRAENKQKARQEATQILVKMLSSLRI